MPKITKWDHCSPFQASTALEPRSSAALCIIVIDLIFMHLQFELKFADGGLTRNERTATFTALKIYREGSEFGPVKYSIGYAFRAGNKDAMLQLHSSENADAQPCQF
jgi:hypothetical protein